MERVDHVDVLIVVEETLFAKGVDFSFANLFAQNFLADFRQFINCQPSRQITQVIFQNDVVDFIVATCFEKLAELWHPSSAAIR